jgi:hypothetical protein
LPNSVVHQSKKIPIASMTCRLRKPAGTGSSGRDSFAPPLAADRSSPRLSVRRDLLATLEWREVTRVGQVLAEKRNAPFRPAKDGVYVYGTFKETVQLVSGKYALIENSREFTLVPWRPVIERQLGKEVGGLVRGNDISWEFGRRCSLGISM